MAKRLWSGVGQTPSVVLGEAVKHGLWYRQIRSLQMNINYAGCFPVKVTGAFSEGWILRFTEKQHPCSSSAQMELSAELKHFKASNFGNTNVAKTVSEDWDLSDCAPVLFDGGKAKQRRGRLIPSLRLVQLWDGKDVGGFEDTEHQRPVRETLCNQQKRTWNGRVESIAFRAND